MCGGPLLQLLRMPTRCSDTNSGATPRGQNPDQHGRNQRRNDPCQAVGRLAQVQLPFRIARSHHDARGGTRDACFASSACIAWAKLFAIRIANGCSGLKEAAACALARTQETVFRSWRTRRVLHLHFELRGNELIIKPEPPMSAYRGMLKRYKLDSADLVIPKEQDREVL